MLTTDTPPNLCPHCGYLLDQATAAYGDHTPSPGDWSICIRCAAILRFDADLKYEAVTEAELAKLAVEDPKGTRMLRKAQRTAQAMNLCNGWPDRDPKSS